MARLALAGVLLWAGGAKLGDLDGSIRAVNAYQLLDPDLARVVGAALPLVEVAVGLFLLTGLATRFAAAAAGTLMAVFVAGIASAWARGLRIDCGCFGGGGELGVDERPAYGGEIARDIALLLAAAFLVVWPRTVLSIDGWLAGRLGRSADLDDLDDFDDLDDEPGPGTATDTRNAAGPVRTGPVRTGPVTTGKADEAEGSGNGQRVDA